VPPLDEDRMASTLLFGKSKLAICQKKDQISDMSIEILKYALVLGIPVVVIIFAYFKGGDAAKAKAELEDAKQDAASDAAAEKVIEKARENAKAAVTASPVPVDAVTTHGLSDEEYRVVFGHDRPHGNS
jgi:hypothetical protein